MAKLAQSTGSLPTTHQTASVAEAKEHLSALLRIVESQKSEIILQRRGKAIAKIIPMPQPEVVSGFGWMKGSVVILGDIDGPTGEEWDVTGE